MPAVLWKLRDMGRARAFAFVLAGGLAWAALQLALATAGHSPSGPLFLPIPRADYYLGEALLVVPMHLLCAALFVGILRRWAAATVSWAALALTLPSLALWWLPDVIAFSMFGFAAMAKVAPIAALTTAFSSVAVTMMLLRREGAPALGPALLAYLAQAALQALVIR